MKPEDIHAEFRDRFRARDLDGLLDLYEEDGVFMLAPGQVQQGRPAIRSALLGFLAIDGEFEVETRYAAQNGDIALLSLAWRLVGKDPTGQAANLQGLSTEVVRRQEDGRWRYILNHPFGGQA